jgi:hypothetical protein
VIPSRYRWQHSRIPLFQDIVHLIIAGSEMFDLLHGTVYTQPVKIV